MSKDFISKESAELYSQGVIAEDISLFPVMINEIENLSQNGRVLDIGCGDGRYSVELAKRGLSVEAFDFSSHQIAIAKEKNNHQQIKYQIGSIEDISFINDKSIDIVFMNMVIPDLKNKETLEKGINEIGRVLKKGGIFLFSTLHPLYVYPDKNKLDYPVDFKEEQYFSEGSSYNAEAKMVNGEIMRFNETHFSLSFISRILDVNNFVIERLVESKGDKEKGIYIPKYIIFRTRLD